MTIQEYIIQLTPIPTAKAEMLATYFKRESLPKGTRIIEEGKTSTKSYFLERGIVRCYLIDRNGEEITTRFYSAPDFLNDYQSFFKQKPSEEYYETLTDCEAMTIDLETVQYCFHNIPEFREWGRMLLTMNYVHMYQTMVSFHKFSAQERYLELLKAHPEIVREVPLKYIASYLGITKHSLSRIRKEISLSP
ncbi:Crp/Fnr family transcriptional regulator [Pontibacter sp. G13]|uniref:Crp/Fnr family transcriptional regulator n=1 Tax=Pontibacter sp. G13 TaxID=3074898 RepID=UPI0028896FFF|nr:Crp/Fnr family transcriptional regulator [Pontibacter sp. G13]WNJ17019.1 Crp/Fnr family transcriptional regulator [Pontibacter sp. G13]